MPHSLCWLGCRSLGVVGHCAGDSVLLPGTRYHTWLFSGHYTPNMRSYYQAMGSRPGFCSGPVDPRIIMDYRYGAGARGEEAVGCRAMHACICAHADCIQVHGLRHHGGPPGGYAPVGWPDAALWIACSNPRLPMQVYDGEGPAGPQLPTAVQGLLKDACWPCGQ